MCTRITHLGAVSPFGLLSFPQGNNIWPGKKKHLLSPFKILIDNKMKGGFTLAKKPFSLFSYYITLYSPILLLYIIKAMGI